MWCMRALARRFVMGAAGWGAGWAFCRRTLRARGCSICRFRVICEKLRPLAGAPIQTADATRRASRSDTNEACEATSRAAAPSWPPTPTDAPVCRRAVDANKTRPNTRSAARRARRLSRKATANGARDAVERRREAARRWYVGPARCGGANTTTPALSMETPQAAANVPASSCKHSTLPPMRFRLFDAWAAVRRRRRGRPFSAIHRARRAPRRRRRRPRPRPVCVDDGVILGDDAVEKLMIRARCHLPGSATAPLPSMSSQASSAAYGPPSEPRKRVPRRDGDASIGSDGFLGYVFHNSRPTFVSPVRVRHQFRRGVERGDLRFPGTRDEPSSRRPRIEGGSRWGVLVPP